MSDVVEEEQNATTSEALRTISQKNEDCNKSDYYPESPEIERRRLLAENTCDEQNFPFTNNWAESTTELYSDKKSIVLKALRNPTWRVFQKDGHENVNFRNLPEKQWRYIRDFVTTLIELDWPYMLFIFLSSYFLTWFIFAVLCYIVSYAHNDLFFDDITGKRLSTTREPCINGVENFVAMLIYSVEVQTTVGFGEKYPSEECPETVFLFILQIICSIGIEGAMISIIYAKTARPAKQLTKLKFSDKAVICYRDGQLCLMFRVCDLREQQTIESKIRVNMLMDKLTNEGEIIKTQSELTLVGNGEQIIIWPEIICHIIDEHSPLYHLKNAQQFNAARFELYVSIVGTSAATALITEARTSYIPREIFWGQRFVNIINYDVLKERYKIDYENFNTTMSVDMTNICKSEEE